MQLPIVWCCLKIAAGEPCTMPGFAVRTWHSPRGLHPRRNQHRPRIRWWWLAKPIANGWPDLLMRSKLRQQPGQGKACSTEA